MPTPDATTSRFCHGLCAALRCTGVFRQVRGVAPQGLLPGPLIVSLIVSLIGLLIGLIALTASAPLAAEPLTMADAMPQTFRIDALSIRLSRQVCNAPWQFRLSGADAGSLTQGGKQRPFPYPAKNLVALLNALYEVHFFDMPSRYATHVAAQLMADGTVSMVGVDSTNATGNGVCVSVASFEKCVRWGNRAPVELERIAQRAFAEAQRLAAER